MLGKIKGRRKREWQDEMVGCIINSVDVSLSKLWEMVKDRVKNICPFIISFCSCIPNRIGLWEWLTLAEGNIFSLTLFRIASAELQLKGWPTFSRFYYSFKSISYPIFRLPRWLKNLPANARDTVLIHWLGRSPGEGKSNLLQYSCLENPMDRGSWWSVVQQVAKSLTWLSD